MTSEDISEVGGSIIDVDRLIVLFENRSIIYDITLADHHNHDLVNQCWAELSEELNVPVSECKQKWNYLRSSYLRHIRESKRMPSGSGQKKKKWHLADAMQFLQKYTGPFIKMTSNLNSQSQAEGSGNGDRQSEETQLDDDTETTMRHPSTKDVPLDYPDPSENENVAPMKKKKKTAVELVAAPMAAYLKATTEQKKQHSNDKEEDATLSFFKSLLPDIKTLNSKRQRKFKSIVMKTLNDLIDEQEDEISGRTFTPISYSNSGSVHSHSASGNSLEGREDWQSLRQHPFLQQHATDYLG